MCDTAADEVGGAVVDRDGRQKLGTADGDEVGGTKAAEKGDMATESCVDGDGAAGTGRGGEVAAGDGGTDEAEVDKTAG